jgi:CysZ protein
MILQSAAAAAAKLLTPQFRAVLFKTLGLTALVLVGAWFAIGWTVETFALPPLASMLPDLPEWTGWLGGLAMVVAGIALALGLGLLIAPVTAVIAGFFLDDVAEIVEREDYPNDPPGRALPLATAAIVSAKFLGLVILGNLLALMLLLVPFVNVAAFFVVNGYLIGREYFEFAALRHRPEADARALRRRHRGTVFAAGLLIAVLLSVPVLNLLTPLFAAAMMVHLHKAISARETRLGAASRVAV